LILFNRIKWVQTGFVEFGGQFIWTIFKKFNEQGLRRGPNFLAIRMVNHGRRKVRKALLSASPNKLVQMDVYFCVDPS
jgi:hypothetical protein